MFFMVSLLLLPWYIKVQGAFPVKSTFMVAYSPLLMVCTPENLASKLPTLI